MSPKEFRKSLKFQSTAKKDEQYPKFNTTDRKKGSDQYSFGGASDPEEREPIENW
jgi:hypothetical protein